MLKIRHIPHDDIDFVKWDMAVESMLNPLPYALSWYLDITAKRSWNGLVYGDYEAVMPLCWNSKIPTVKQIYQPVLTQQLGVFGSCLTSTLVKDFIMAIPADYKKIHFHLNEDLSNQIDVAEGVNKTNLLLTIDSNFEEISSNYSKSLRKRLRKTELLIIEKRGTIEEVIAFFKQNVAPKSGVPEVDYEIPKYLFNELENRGFLKIYSVRNQEDILLANGAFIHYNGRVINIFGSSNEEGRNCFAMHAMLNSVIKEHAGNNQYFDFEGSDLPGVKEFFLSFGARNFPYIDYTLDKTPLVIKSITKLAKKIGF